jgi:hypothetical protein
MLISGNVTRRIVRLIDTKGNISMSIIATVTDAFEVNTDSNGNDEWYLGDMLLGFNEMMLDRILAMHACSQIIMHRMGNDIISKLTHGSMVHAGGVHVPQVSRTSTEVLTFIHLRGVCCRLLTVVLYHRSPPCWPTFGVAHVLLDIGEAFVDLWGTGATLV